MDKNYITDGIVGVAPVLAASATTTAIKTTNATYVKIEGVVYPLAATAVCTAIPSTITVPALSTGVVGVYVSFATGAAVFSYAQVQSAPANITTGTSVTTPLTVLTSTLTNTAIAPAGLFPEEVPGKALIGYLIITATTAFTGGTSVIGTGNTVVYIDKYGFVGK